MTTATTKWGNPLTVRLTVEQRAALEWHRRIFPGRFPSMFAVLQEHSLNELVAAYNAAQQDSAKAAA